MKKYLLLLTLGAFLTACSAGTPREESQETTLESIQAMEQSIQELENVLISTEAEVDSLQNEINALLHGI